MTTLLWLCAGLAVLAFINTCVNLLYWPRGLGVQDLPKVSVLVPARNEEDNIQAAVQSALAAGADQVVVYEDGSTDRTAERLRAIRDPRLKVVTGTPLPEGWVGKPHACHQLSTHATGDVWVFMDADVQLRPDGLRRIAFEMNRMRADVLSAVPAQETHTWFEQWLMPMLHVTYNAWLPLFLIHSSPNPRFLAANGQLIAFTPRAYASIGGFEAVRLDVVDDMAITRLAKRQGHRVVFADGFHMASCRMYRTPTELWEGFSKNVYEGLGSEWALALAIGLNLGAWVLPWVGLLFAVWNPALLGPSLLGVACGLMTRAALAQAHRHHWWSIVLHPTAVLMLVAIALNSWRWHRQGQVTWAGRVYDSRDNRGARSA